MPDVLIVLYVIMVLAIFALFLGLSSLVRDWRVRQGGHLRRRTLADDMSPWLAKILPTDLFRQFELLVRAAGLGESAFPILTVMLLTGAAAVLILHILGYDWSYGVGVGLLVGLFLPLLLLRRMRRKRFGKLLLQLPDAIDTLVRSLRVGHPVPLGIAIIASEMPDPIAGEFRQVSDAMSYGLDFRDALENLRARVRLPEVKYMVAAIRIQYATGGDLAEVLATLADVMRERVRFKMKVKALSAESRFSGNIMMFLPFVMIGGLFYLRPDLYKDVPTSSLLQWLMGGAALLLVTGIVLMRHLVNIRA